MSRDYILTCDDGKRYSFDNLCSQKWLEGQPVGAEVVVGWLVERAVDLLRRGKTNDAAAMRRLADEAHEVVIPKLEEAVKQHRENHPALLDGKEPA